MTLQHDLSDHIGCILNMHPIAAGFPESQGPVGPCMFKGAVWQAGERAFMPFALAIDGSQAEACGNWGGIWARALAGGKIIKRLLGAAKGSFGLEASNQSPKNTFRNDSSFEQKLSE
jgi:hypothetical protein